MNWQQQTIERQKLFDQIWAEPMTKVAKVYAMSDVGLRKICVALDVPLPPRGYWAKLAAGKAPTKPTLHPTKVATTYARSQYVARVDETMEERFALARRESPPPVKADLPAYCPAIDPQAFLPQTKLATRALKGIKLEEGVRNSSGITWADISVSDGLMERTLLLVDRFAYELQSVGAKFENTHPPLPTLRRGMRREPGTKRNCASIRDQHFFVRIRELITQELVPPPPPKAPPARSRAAPARSAWEYRPPEYRYIPTGKLQVAIVNAHGYYEWYKLEDTASGTIEDKVRKTIFGIENEALRQQVEAEVRAERELDRRAKAHAWEQRKATKDNLLAALAAFEQMSKDLDRAESLRRFRDRVKAHPSPPTELASRLKQLTLMADWLDPLVKAPWPEIDDVGGKNPHGSWW